MLLTACSPVKQFEGGADRFEEENKEQLDTIARIETAVLTRLVCTKSEISDEEIVEQFVKIASLESSHIPELYQQCPDPEINPSSPSYGRPVWGLLNAVNNVSCSVFSSIKSGFQKTEHPWEKQKYDLSLKGIIYAFQKIPVKLGSLYQMLKEQAANPTPFQQKTLEVLECISYPNPERPYFLNHIIFIEKLRKTLSCAEFQNICTEIAECRHQDIRDPFVISLLLICLYRFTEVDLHPFAEEYVIHVLQEGIKALGEAPENHPLCMPLEKQFEAIASAPKTWTVFEKLKKTVPGAINFNYDPHKCDNIPYILYDMSIQSKEGEAKVVRVIRVGTPTRQRTDYNSMTWQGAAQIIPEFETFTGALTLLHKKLLFLSLQDDHERLIGSETERNRALHKLQQKFSNTFYLGILSHDSAFYYQTGEFSQMDEADIFLNTFKKMLCGERNGYHLPSEWLQNADFTAGIGTILEELHEDLFEKKKSFILLERLGFIDIAYARLALSFLKHSGADFLIFCCKDSMDRAGKCNAILFKIILILIRKEEDEAYKRKFHVDIHAATLFVKEQVMNNRRERLLLALSLLERPLVKERLRKRQPSIGINGLLSSD